MIAMKCRVCNHEVQVSPEDQERGFPCSNCGHFVSRDSSLPASSGDRIVPSSTPSANDPTLAGTPTTSTPVGLGFLSPASGPDEIGWLAHYQVKRVLGQGGMGVVFEAFDTRLHRPVALKVMKPEIAQDDLAKQRFLREARGTAALKSDNVVTIHDVGQANDVPFLSMEFLKGEPLDAWLARRGRPTLEEALRIGAGVARGLAAAHQLGLIHRDIKPSNIWVELPQERAKILDFGLARVEKEASNLTNSGVILGTPAYMAPEQAEHARVDARSDLFSLGCVLYELTTGLQAFSGASTMAVLMAVATKDPTPPAQLYPDTPPALSRLVMHLLAKNPADRPASAQEVVDRLEAIAAEANVCTLVPSSGVRPMPTPLPGPAPTRPASTTATRPTGLVLGIGIGAIVGLLALGLIGWQLFGKRPGTDPGVDPAARATAPGVTHTEILLGMTGPFAGSSADLGREMEIGLTTYFNAINDQGGVHGRQIKLVSLDDGYEPSRTLANLVELREQRKVFATIGNVGSGSAGKSVPYAVQNQFLYFGGFSGAKVLRNVPPDRYVFNFRAGYEEEIHEIVTYLIKKRKIAPHEIAAFTQNDGLGDDGFRGIAKALAPHDREEGKILHVRYERNTVQVQEAVDTLLKHPEIRAVIMVGTYRPSTVFIQKLKDAKRDLLFANISFVGSLALAEGLVELGPTYAEGVIVTQVVPPINSSATGVLRYREALKKHHPSARPSFVSLEGYLAAALFTEGLKKAGEKLTTESLVDALESLRDVDLGTGTLLGFSPSRHQASRKIWGTQLDKSGTFQSLDLD